MIAVNSEEQSNNFLPLEEAEDILMMHEVRLPLSCRCEAFPAESIRSKKLHRCC